MPGRPTQLRIVSIICLASFTPVLNAVMMETPRFAGKESKTTHFKVPMAKQRKGPE